MQGPRSPLATVPMADPRSRAGFCYFCSSVNQCFLKAQFCNLYLQLGLQLGFQKVHDSCLLLLGMQTHLLVHRELGQELLLLGQHPAGRKAGRQAVQQEGREEGRNEGRDRGKEGRREKEGREGRRDKEGREAADPWEPQEGPGHQGHH